VTKPNLPHRCPSGQAQSPVPCSNYIYDLCGAKEIRTPDLLHAIQAQPIARRCQTSLCGLFTCGDSGWVWPGVAWQLASLAPNLAPRNSLASLCSIDSNTPGRRTAPTGPAGAIEHPTLRIERVARTHTYAPMSMFTRVEWVVSSGVEVGVKCRAA
jgi:hypothetical protein